MAFKFFWVDFAELSKTSSLFLTIRIKKYNQNYSSDYLPLSYFLDNKNVFKLGQVKREDYQTHGEFPIVDQSQEFIAGYSDEVDLVYSGDLPVIIFGDHTRIFKYIDFKFIQGADGIKIIKPNKDIVNPKFFYYLMSKMSIPSRGYNRHFSILKKQKYPLLPKPTQDHVVAQIEPLEKNIKELKTTLTPPQEIINEVFAKEFGFDLEKFKDLKKEKFFEVDFFEFSKHRDLRFGIGIRKTNIDLKPFISKNFEYKNLGKIISLEYGYGLIEQQRMEGDYPVMGANGIVGYHKEFLIEGPSIIVGRKGSAGEINYIEENNYPIDTCFYVKFLKEQNIVYFSYLLKFLQLKRLTLFKGVPGLNRYDVYDIKIPNLPLKSQQTIVDKIKAALDQQENIKSKIKSERNKIDAIIEKAIHLRCRT